MTLAPLAINGKVVVGRQWWRSGYTRLRGCLRCQDRETSMAVSGRFQARATRTRFVDGRQLENWRRAHLGYGDLRSRVEPGLWGWAIQVPTGTAIHEMAITYIRARCWPSRPILDASRWYFQFTPHDTHDWDSNHVPILFDTKAGDRKRRLVAIANRNAFLLRFGSCHRRFVAGRPYAKQTGQRGSMRRVGLSDYRVPNLQKRAPFFTRTRTALRFGSVHPTALKLVWCTSRFVRSARRTSNAIWSTRSARSTHVV